MRGREGEIKPACRAGDNPPPPKKNELMQRYPGGGSSPDRVVWLFQAGVELFTARLDLQTSNLISRFFCYFDWLAHTLNFEFVFVLFTFGHFIYFVFMFNANQRNVQMHVRNIFKDIFTGSK